MSDNKNTLLLIDGNGLMHRAFHALPPLTNSKGEATGAVYGFFSALISVVSQYDPRYLLVCLDFPAKTFRDDLFEHYRAQRPDTDVSLKTQFPLLKKLLSESKIAYTERSGFEADDLLASAAYKYSQSERVLVMTADKDLLQLVDDRISVISPILNSHQISQITDKETVKAKLGVTPDQVADLKALCGDPSDNYKGIVGIGPKTAAGLLVAWGDLEGIYAHLDEIASDKVRQLLTIHEQEAWLGRKLARLVTDISLPFTLTQLDTQRFYQDLAPVMEHSFKSLFSRVNKLANQSTATTTTSQPITDQPSLF